MRVVKNVQINYGTSEIGTVISEMHINEVLSEIRLVYTQIVPVAFGIRNVKSNIL